MLSCGGESVLGPVYERGCAGASGGSLMRRKSDQMERNGAEGLLCVLMKSTRLLTCKLEMAAITQWISTPPYPATVDNFIFSFLHVHDLMRGYMYCQYWPDHRIVV